MDYLKLLKAFILSTVLIPVVSPLGLPAQESEPNQRIEALMSAEEFSAAGLAQLSPEQLAALNRWLYGYVVREKETAVEEAMPSGDRSFGLEHLTDQVARMFHNSPEIIESSISGPFKGWDGNTVFRLENGQVWRQFEPGTFYYPTKDPAILIRKSRFGSYHLRVKGKNSSVRVVRIEGCLRTEDPQGESVDCFDICQ